MAVADGTANLAVDLSPGILSVQSPGGRSYKVFLYSKFSPCGMVSFAAFRYQIVIGSVGIVPVKIFSIRPKHLNQRYLAFVNTSAKGGADKT